VSFSATFCLGLGTHLLLAQETADSRDTDRALIHLIGPISPPPLEAASPSPSPTTQSRISQEKIIRFPAAGAVRVSALENRDGFLELKFADQDSERSLLTSYLGSPRWNWTSDPKYADLNPKLRFKAISVHGLPSPLVVGIAMNPGVSDSGWEAVAVGVVNGQLEQLTYESLETSNEGGFFFGDLGHGMGLGAAQWDFIWGEGEGHPPPHKYEIKLYKWSGRRFEWEKVIRTRKQYDSPQAALSAYGFRFVDVREMFPDWGDIASW
jgi:hypothetical protein